MSSVKLMLDNIYFLLSLQILQLCANMLLFQSVENCACILHNLSYHLDSEVPNKYSQLNEQMLRNQQTDKTSTGCFSNKSEKIQVKYSHLQYPYTSKAEIHSTNFLLKQQLQTVILGSDIKWGNDCLDLVCYAQSCDKLFMMFYRLW